MWHFDGTRGSFSTSDFTGKVEPKCIGLGMVDVQWRGVRVPGHFLGIRLPPGGASIDETVVDCYARQHDLIATFAEGPARNVRPQAYWRMIDDGAKGVGLEVIASVQTNLLDTRPILSTSTEVHATSVKQLVNAESGEFSNCSASGHTITRQRSSGLPAFLMILPDGAGAYFEMAMLADYHGTELHVPAPSDPARLSFSLLGEHLEKGVIRRTRIRGLFLPSLDPEASAIHCYREFLEAPLPLTT